MLKNPSNGCQSTGSRFARIRSSEIRFCMYALALHKIIELSEVGFEPFGNGPGFSRRIWLDLDALSVLDG